MAHHHGHNHDHNHDQSQDHSSDQHSHSYGCSHHHHHHTDNASAKTLLISFVLISLFMLVEYWAGFTFNSLALMADAGHMLNDSFSLGIGFQNAKFNLALLPFVEQTLYAGGSNQSDTLKRFSKASGASLETSYWLSPQWQWNVNYEYGEQRYTKRKHLNGNYHFASTGLLYLASAKQYWFGNISYHRNSARDKDDAYFRRGVQLGWGQEWGKGFSTRLSVSLAEKRYKAPMPIFNITQRNKEYGIQASIWHRAVHFWGITPRLTYHLNRTKSNHAFYSYDKSRLFVDFSKQF